MLDLARECSDVISSVLSAELNHNVLNITILFSAKSATSSSYNRPWADMVGSINIA